MTFGETVQQTRLSKNIWLTSFASQIGTRPVETSRWERNEDLPPSENVVRRMAQVLNLDPEELVELYNRERDPQTGADASDSLSKAGRPFCPAFLYW